MASPVHLLHVMNEMAGSLTSDECRRLSYLCGSPDSDSSVAGVKELLRTQLMRRQTGDLFLVELMFVLRRFDILRKVLGTSRDEAERSLAQRHVLSRYSTLPREKMDQATTFLDVLVELEKLDKVSSESVDFVEQCLRSIGRVDLARKVHVYQRPAPQNFPLPSPLDEYKLHTDPRGICVIIDCVGNDGEMLERTFKSLRFKVTLKRWLGVDGTVSALRDIFRHRENHVAGAFVCCIISRGTATDLLATDSGRTGLHLDTLRHLFSAEACPALAGKPKLFFIQRYAVPEPQACVRAAHRDEDLETDGADSPSRWELVPTDADVFWSHCWTDECQLEQGHHRSVYLQALTNALHKGQRRKIHLVDLHTEVNGAIYEHNKRNPGEIYHIDLKHTLRKNLYLP
ncbi:CASP8 and FADD-like apoptosis regulator [Diretmus argenteus]